MENSKAVQVNGGGSSCEEPIIQRPSPTIEQFLAAFDSAADGLVKVGEMLVTMHWHDRHIFTKIREARPAITMEALEMLMNFGNHVIHPSITNLNRNVINHILGLRVPYETQKELMEKPIEVVSRLEGDKPIIIREHLANLPQRLAKIATCKKGNAPIKEQIRKHLKPVEHKIMRQVSSEVPIRKQISKGLYAIRKNVAGTWIFEKTTARPYNVQKVLVEGFGGDMTATIEIVQWDK